MIGKIKTARNIIIGLLIGLCLGFWIGSNWGKGQPIFSNPFVTKTLKNKFRETGGKVLEESGKALEKSGKALRQNLKK